MSTQTAATRGKRGGLESVMTRGKLGGIAPAHVRVSATMTAVSEPQAAMSITGR